MPGPWPPRPLPPRDVRAGHTPVPGFTSRERGSMSGRAHALEGQPPQVGSTLPEGRPDAHCLVARPTRAPASWSTRPLDLPNLF